MKQGETGEMVEADEERNNVVDGEELQYIEEKLCIKIIHFCIHKCIGKNDFVDVSCVSYRRIHRI